MINSYSIERNEAYSDMYKKWPQRVPWEKKELDQLHAEYTAEHGYGVLVPDFHDIIHYLPNKHMTLEHRRERKQRHLYRILSSPQPGWAQSYASAMCWLDNIQDAMTTGLVLSMVVRKWLPRIFARAVPILGWVLLAYDLLSMLVALGRTPFTPMKSKRALCELVRSNPFTKKSRRQRQFRLWNMKPSWGAACEVLQTSDWLFGVGLSLGAIFGTITDAVFGGYKYITGQPVEIRRTPPLQKMYETTGFRSLKAAAMISAAGQTFEDELHFWTYITYTGNVVLTAPLIHLDPPEDYFVNPMAAMIPAPRPTNPETIGIIEAAGLSVSDGVRWPANQSKEISLDELTDWQAVKCYDSVTDYLLRHKNDWYGFLAGCWMNEAHSILLDAVDEEAELEESYNPITHVALQMLKEGITPTDDRQKQEWDKFEQWCNDFWGIHDHAPSIAEIEEHLEICGVSYRSGFPEEQDPESLEVFPPGSLDETLWEEIPDVQWP